MLVDRARSDGLQLTGEGGLLQQLTKRVLESALEGEITDHVGYGKHDAAGRNSGNSRNGTRSKIVLTDVGPVEVRVPRDVTGSFEPQIVKSDGQHRLRHSRRPRPHTPPRVTQDPAPAPPGQRLPHRHRPDDQPTDPTLKTSVDRPAPRVASGVRSSSLTPGWGSRRPRNVCPASGWPILNLDRPRAAPSYLLMGSSTNPDPPASL